MTDQIAALIDKLLALSEGDKVAWQDTAQKNMFLASVSNFVVTISEQPAGAFPPPYSFTVADSAGKTLEHVVLRGEETYPVRLRRLYELARRRARRVDAQLSELLSTLERI